MVSCSARRQLWAWFSVTKNCHGSASYNPLVSLVPTNLNLWMHSSPFPYSFLLKVGLPYQLVLQSSSKHLRELGETFSLLLVGSYFHPHLLLSEQPFSPLGRGGSFTLGWFRNQICEAGTSAPPLLKKKVKGHSLQSRTMYLGLLGARRKNILQFLSRPLTGVVYHGCSLLAHMLKCSESSTGLLNCPCVFKRQPQYLTQVCCFHADSQKYQLVDFLFFPQHRVLICDSGLKLYPR